MWVRCAVMLLSRRDCAPSAAAAKLSAGGPRSAIRARVVVVVVIFCVFFSSFYTFLPHTIPRANDIIIINIVVLLLFCGHVRIIVILTNLQQLHRFDNNICLICIPGYLYQMYIAKLYYDRDHNFNDTTAAAKHNSEPFWEHDS